MNLALLTFLPLLGALLVGLTPGGAEKAQRAIALVTTLVVAVLGVMLFASFDGTQAGAQFLVDRAWFEIPVAGGQPIPIRFTLGVDGISILMVLLTAILMPIVVLSTPGHIDKRVKEFMIWLLVMETGMLGVFVALDMVLFYFFWEVSLVPLYFIIGIWGSARRIYATIKFFLYTLAGSLVMLVAVIALLYTLGTASVQSIMAQTGGLPLSSQIWLFLAFALAFAIKVPMLPFHTWLADAHTEAPTSGSVILAGVLLKMGTYGLLRFGVQMFPAAALETSGVFLALGALGVVYGAFLAMAQTDVKRLVACSSVSHLGFVVLGIFAMTSAGLRGSVLQMVNHGLSTGLLFLLVGMIYERRHTRDLDQYGGIATVMPVFSFFFALAMLSSVGLPGLNGFVGEYLILLGTFQADALWAVVGVTGIVWGAIYLLMATRKLLFGPVTREENARLRDLDLREVGLMLPVVVLIVWIGVSPGTFLGRTEASIDALVQRVDDARGTRVGGLDADHPEAPRGDARDGRR